MYNPFPTLTAGLLANQLTEGKRWFVRQTFPRGMVGRITAAFLIRGYWKDEEALAIRHMARLQGKDGNAFLYDAANPEHVIKLQTAAGEPFGYKVYYAAKKGVDWKPPKKIEENIRRYISAHHPNWRAQREGGEILVGLYEEFGELFIKFKHRDEEDYFPFEVIEGY